MAFIFRTMLILLAVTYSASAYDYTSKTTLCLFKGQPEQSNFTAFWLEEEGTNNIVPFYYMNDLRSSKFNNIKVSLKDGSNGDALIYLYHDREATDENVTFVNYDKTAYHFSGSKVLNSEKWTVVGGTTMLIGFGSCIKPEYRWKFVVNSTHATVAGYVVHSDSWRLNPSALRTTVSVLFCGAIILLF
ncbi:hypothetical protein V1515DRAFT_255570 [Lipomyces mesembrius]